MIPLSAAAAKLGVKPSRLVEIFIQPAAPPGIYVLCHEGEIVYIGQAVNVYKRIEDHRKDKVFDQVFFKPCRPEHLSRFESELIHRLRPRLNGTHPNGEKCAPRRRFNETPAQMQRALERAMARIG